MIYLVAQEHLAQICASRDPIRGALAESFAKYDALLPLPGDDKRSKDSVNLTQNPKAYKCTLYGLKHIFVF